MPSPQLLDLIPKIETLRKEMHKACDEFKMMPTAELQEKKSACPSLEIKAE